MKRLLRIVVSLAVLFGLVFGTVSLVRLANGDFAGDYKLSGTFPRAGEGLDPGLGRGLPGSAGGPGVHHLPPAQPGADHHAH